MRPGAGRGEDGVAIGEHDGRHIVARGDGAHLLRRERGIGEDRADSGEPLVDFGARRAEQNAVVSVGDRRGKAAVEAVVEGAGAVRILLYDRDFRQALVEPVPGGDAFGQMCGLAERQERIDADLRGGVEDAEIAEADAREGRAAQAGRLEQRRAKSGERPDEARRLREQHHTPAEVVVDNGRAQECADQERGRRRENQHEAEIGFHARAARPSPEQKRAEPENAELDDIADGNQRGAQGLARKSRGCENVR